MIETWKKQFTAKQLSPVHDAPITFVSSQWQREPRPSAAYLVYRWLMALWFCTVLVLSVADLKRPDESAAFRAKWLIYLTNWGYSSCTLQALVAALMLSGCVLARRQPNLQKTSLKFYKLYWIVNTIATDIAFGITTLYWSLIYDEKTMDLDAMNLLVHGSNSVMMMIDLFVVSHPVRLLHCCYTVAFGLCYAVFSLIFYAAGGISREGQEYIYNILDWSNPGKTSLICVGITAFMIIVHVIAWTLHKLRLWLFNKYFVKVSEVIEDKDPEKMAYVNAGLAIDMI